MTKDQFQDITQWQVETFGKANANSKIAHLKEEVEELQVDVEQQNANRRMEFADCFILLFGAAASDGMSYEDICSAIHDKMKINKSRIWGEPKENGVVNHIRV